MTRGLVYIASLSHSGSTLLDLLLGIHPNMVGLGEISKVLDLDGKGAEENLHMACTCGKRAGECSFWGEFLPTLKWLEGNSKRAKYEALINHFYKQYDDDIRIVDSSKYLSSLEDLSAIKGIDIKVLHLMKDVRAFCLSHRRSSAAEIDIGRLPKLLNSKEFSLWTYERTIKSPSYLFWKWYLRNQSQIRAINKLGHSYLSISYDQLAQSPAAEMQRISEFLDLAPIPADKLVPRQSTSHIFLGNPMIGSPEKMEAIRYDDRWKDSDEWQRAANIFGAIMDFNEKMVQSP